MHTRRLTLRAFTPADLDALHTFNRLPEVARYLYWRPRTLEQTRAALEVKLGQTSLTESDQEMAIAVELRSTGHLIGEASLFYRSKEHRQAEIGYVFNPEFHGHGYATETARELLRLAFDGLGAHRTIGRLDARNTRSAALLQRLGMRREAYLAENEFVKGEWADEVVYAMLDREWRAR
ncbi:GNAT family N-acetyltransferase [Sinosporangium siamense]|uniref:GNAT family N-acetyltransferase n=1 Tax=Sinosporangium siamense TaxID=1367973 RepID=UPI001EF20206|nr:GNAT family N-acetyltransferase [Sinosporangium siamense]